MSDPSTLAGRFAGDFADDTEFQSHLSNPPMTIQRDISTLDSFTTRTLSHFSVPSGKTLKVFKSYVADGNGDPASGLSMLVRDTTDAAVITSVTSAEMQEGEPLGDRPAGGNKVTVEIKNDSGVQITDANGLVAISIE